MSYETIAYEPGPVARVILNRPEQHNAQSWTLLSEVDDAFHAAVMDPQCRIIVLSGAGRSFSAGHDDSAAPASEPGWMGGLDAFGRTELLREVYIDRHLRWRDLGKPTVAMVHGYCIHGGWMIASAMDFIFASDDALLFPTYGGYFTTVWDVGGRKAKEILYENRFITAKEAMQWGFVNRVYPAADLQRETLRYAGRVAEGSPFGNRTVKFAINQTLDMMGFTTSVRWVSPDFHNRRVGRPPDTREGQPAPADGRPAAQSPGRQRDLRFRSQVARALEYLRQDGITPRFASKKQESD